MIATRAFALDRALDFAGTHTVADIEAGVAETLDRMTHGYLG